MSIELKRIYLENYKLFASKSIEFENYLSVFDGPNGYGKTSIFDAVEFLITGSISRIKENQTISGTLGFSTNFLAKEQTKDVLIKGEFINKESSELLVIALLIPVGLGTNSKKNNPKSIDNQVETFFLPAYDIAPENWNEYKVELDVANNIRRKYFGAQNLEFFTMLHYIRQEDRLSYFKKSEADRTAAIENLFGIQSHISKATKIEQTHKHVQQKIKSLDKEIEQLSEEVLKVPEGSKGQTQYTSLSDIKPKWDHENLDFYGAKSRVLFEQLTSQVDGIKEMFIHREEFYLDYDLQTFFEITESQRMHAILAWKVWDENPDEVTELKKQKTLLDFLLTQRDLIDKQQFANVDWLQLCNILDLREFYEQFSALVTQIRIASSNRSDLQKSISSLKRAREQLSKEKQTVALFENGKCPYCGQKWQDNGELENQFSKTQQLIDAVLGREFVEYTFAVEQCKELFNKQCKVHFDSIISNLENNMKLKVFAQFSSWQMFQNSASKCAPIMKRLGVVSSQIQLEKSVQDVDKAVIFILNQIKSLKDTISAEYLELNQKYNFSKLYKESFVERQVLDGLSIESIEQKKEYIVKQYYHSFDKSRERLQMIEAQRNELKDLSKQLKGYLDAMKNAIRSYKNLVIGQIEIPFFLYSSRLLQSYQGGQGVLIKSDGKNVRFTAPGSEHDVLYTMSSGQLSAVLLAFSLALNKIYAGDIFQTIMIDDPIQCMDDINMISFVELLRREFGKSQIILSTHEDTFANYICYKFQKYGCSEGTITLKDS